MYIRSLPTLCNLTVFFWAKQKAYIQEQIEEPVINNECINLSAHLMRTVVNST